MFTECSSVWLAVSLWGRGVGRIFVSLKPCVSSVWGEKFCYQCVVDWRLGSVVTRAHCYVKMWAENIAQTPTMFPFSWAVESPPSVNHWVYLKWESGWGSSCTVDEVMLLRRHWFCYCVLFHCLTLSQCFLILGKSAHCFPACKAITILSYWLLSVILCTLVALATKNILLYDGYRDG